MPLPLVLVHGYSDKGESFRPWRDLLCAKGYRVEDVCICNYQSLTNEVTVKDIAEGFDRALRTQASIGPNQPFDAIVHSTGMLVIRSWLATYAPRRGRLKHLIGLAPASFGSPLAHKGRSLLGSVFKGRKERGPDFLEAGDMILDGLELGSRFTWDLTHKDLLGEQPFYGKHPDTPYVFIFCGTEGYSGLRRFINEPGTDGTVRLAGCPLNTVKFSIDLSREAEKKKTEEDRVKPSNLASKGTLEISLYPVAGKNHATIVSEPGDDLVDLVYRALQVDSQESFDSWSLDAAKRTAPALKGLPRWQQFVVHVVDERGDPINDWYIEFFGKVGGEDVPFDLDLDVHAYGADKSLRCFHLNLDELEGRYRREELDNLWIRLIASSGSQFVGYHGLRSEKISPDLTEFHEEGLWDAQIPLPPFMGKQGRYSFFHPFTTTFVEICLNREPLPFGMVESRVCGFLKD